MNRMQLAPANWRVAHFAVAIVASCAHLGACSDDSGPFGGGSSGRTNGGTSGETSGGVSQAGSQVGGRGGAGGNDDTGGAPVEGGNCGDCSGSGGTGATAGSGATMGNGGADAGNSGIGGIGGDAGNGGMGGGGEPSEPLTWLGECEPIALSGNAKTVLTTAGVWTANTGWIGLPDLPGGNTSNHPLAVSANGLVIVGYSDSAQGSEIYRWEPSGALQGLGVAYVPGSQLAVSGDGEVVVGWRISPGVVHPVPFRWTEDEGARDLDPSSECGTATPVPGLTSYASYLSADGGTAVFSADSGVCRWTLDGGMEIVPGSEIATAVSGDGAVIARFVPHGASSIGSVAGTSLDCLYVPPANAPPTPRPRCSAAHVTLTDLDFQGLSGVGMDWDGGEAESSLSPAYTIYWSADAGVRSLTTRFAEQGWCLPVGTAPAFLSDDGRRVLSATAWAGAPLFQSGCFLATLSDDRPPPQPAGTGYGCGSQCTGALLESNAVTCAVRMDGQVACWSPWHLTPGAIPGVSNAVEVATNPDWSCARSSDGAVSCWRTPGAGWALSLTSQLSGAERVVAGGGHFCALLEDHTVACWGKGDVGEIGDGASVDRESPVAVAGLDAVVAIDAGARHTCALRQNGGIWCWGSDYGPLRVQVGSLPTAVSLSLGGSVPSPQDCALLSSGEAVCWNASDRVFRSLDAPTDLKQLSVGVGQVCVLRGDGSVWCWGQNTLGEVGAPPSDREELPTRVEGLGEVVQIEAGNALSCALLADSTIRCWGAERLMGSSLTCADAPPARSSPVSIPGPVAPPSGLSAFVDGSAQFERQLRVLEIERDRGQKVQSTFGPSSGLQVNLRTANKWSSTPGPVCR